MGPSSCTLLLAFSSSWGKAQQLETSSLVPTSLKGPFLLHLGKGDVQHLQLKNPFACHWGERQGVIPLVVLVWPPNSEDSATQSPSTMQSHNGHFQSLATPRYGNDRSLGTVFLLLHWRLNCGHHLPRTCMCALSCGVRAGRANGL